MADKGRVLEPVPQSAVFGHAARNGQIALALASAAMPAAMIYDRLATAIISGDCWPLALVETEAVAAGQGS
jgi:chromosome partitioning protein